MNNDLQLDTVGFNEVRPLNGYITRGPINFGGFWIYVDQCEKWLYVDYSLKEAIRRYREQFNLGNLEIWFYDYRESLDYPKVIKDGVPHTMDDDGNLIANGEAWNLLEWDLEDELEELDEDDLYYEDSEIAS